MVDEVAKWSERELKRKIRHSKKMCLKWESEVEHLENLLNCLLETNIGSDNDGKNGNGK